MEPIYEATKLLSGTLYPTQGDLRIAFTIIMQMLKSKMVADPPTTQSLVAAAINSKLENYWVYLNNSSIISAIIDPSHKLEAFNETKIKAKKIFEDKYKSYIKTTTTFS